MALGNTRTFTKLVVMTLGMFGFGFAMVPFYYKICEVTGLNSGDEQVLVKNSQMDTARWVNIELDANTNQNLAWQFRPLQRTLKVHPGQLVQVEYEVTNTGTTTIVGQAVPSYGPARAGRYFKKIECFCFRPQTLAAGEKRRMPVMFVLDPAIEKELNTITLSYTFFNLDEKQAKTQRSTRGETG